LSSQEPLPDDVAETIARCADALGDLDRLRDELHVLRLSSDPRGQFATSLFDLERARRGDAEAREQLTEVADALLVFWREGTGEDLAQLHPALEELWASAASLLANFEARRFERAAAACWAARGDLPSANSDMSALAEAIEGLQPEGNRRVEFARCLYHLELARAQVEGSRAEFARRAGLLAEAYQDSTVAQQLVGDDTGLAHLWAELVPYLDEFFEGLEEQAERRRLAATRAEVKTDPGLAVAPTEQAPAVERRIPGFNTLTGQRDEFLAGRGDVITPMQSPAEHDLTPRESQAVTPDTLDDDLVEAVVEGVADAPPPPPPADFTPPGAWFPPSTPGGEIELAADEFLEATPSGPPPPPPPPPNLTPARGLATPVAEELSLDDFDDTPDTPTLDFWAHTFETLQLLPNDETGRGSRILSVDGRAERKRLSEYVDSLAPHLAVHEARAMSGLIRLMLAGQTKEKTLFGQPNPRRAEAMAAALPFLASTPAAAGHVAVWFELDGPETEATLQQGLALLADYLSFCARVQKDPLHPDTVSLFVRK
jgi:hypothetical protein